ncbi:MULTISPECIES: phosphatidate cytidylyltransferase [Streptomyces]|uniref:phosphatidate cytidylyltransferase n=1 Tax=Streptomyces TaxID=1883 RepID=UPI00081E99C5|nr:MULTISPECIES: phosphatidate cytidylyltransferase [unclassified Streptomyces]MBJ7003697.1 phosphatidate cytidylyltransferase [Streptomyces sp. CRPSP2-6A1]MYQ92891.1 phosphatidate cytidylyltransferase [Streptomyces sp. SID4946]SCF77623.1 phosphatidate cytidylyltransferase [Streptomyces sp. DconLS]SCF79337.1 phosphatidate cytidylyltransferase [Streptomyces sp. LamerLS-31b]
MSDSSWGAPPPAGRTGYWGPTEGGPVQGGDAPAGPAYDAPAAQQTRPMPIVPDVPAYGGDQDDARGAARLSGPLFRDEPQPQYGTPPQYGTEPPYGERPSYEPQSQQQPFEQRPQYGQQQPYGSQPQPLYGTPQPTPAPTPIQNPVPMPDAPQQTPAPQKKSAGRDLSAAIGVGVGLGVVIIASLFIVKAVFVGVIAVAVVVGLWELTSRLQERKEIKAPLVPLAVGGAAMVVAGYVRGAEGAWVAMALTALAVLVWRMTEPPEGYLKDVTAGVFAAFYVPFLATFVALMLTADDGPWRVLTFLLLTVVSDTGAYAVGWRFGKHKLAPRISPGKTREGLFGAVSFSMVVGALCMQFLIDGGHWWQGLLLGLAVAASATLGDLGESMIKRDLGIKDMGTLLPGHGGIMDRLDSLLPTAPVVWLLLVLFVGST